jgi:ribosomal protein S18 acetylase RimI-like enzyme
MGIQEVPGHDTAVRVVDLKSDRRLIEQYVALRNSYAELLLAEPVDVPGTGRWMEEKPLELRALERSGELLGAVILYLARGGEVAFFAKAKGRGIGTRLLDIIEAVAKERRLSSVWAWVREDNAIARHVFEKRGFEKEEMSEREYRGAKVSCIRYRKEI